MKEVSGLLDQICGHIHNYFAAPEEVRRGSYVIEGGGLELPFLREGQYFRIVGSVLNDGVYPYPVSGLRDEVFIGEIWPMRVPADVLRLAEEIAAWQNRCGTAAAGPFQSESFGGYSYTKANAAGWQSAFRNRLDQYRKLA